jgi:hypothetical protein
MIPRTFPSTYASNGQQQMVVHFLTSVAGLARWSDYIPVKLVQGGPENSYNGTIDVAVIPSLTANTQAWKEYIPVYVDNSATDAWTVNNIGYIPYNYALFNDAAMQLDLTNGAALDPRITFSRTTNATVTGSNGLIQYAPHNLLTFSEQFDNAVWAKLTGGAGVAPVVTANAAVAPNGTTTADQVVFNRGAGTSGSDISYLAFSLTAFTATATASVWLKTTDGTTKTMSFRCGAPAAQQITVTGEWQRFTLTQTNATIDRVQILLYGNDGTQTVSVNVWGAQLELGSTATTYNPTTVKNLLGFTEHFDNAAWTKSNATIDAVKVTDIYGQPFAQKLVVNTSTAVHSAAQDFSALNGVVYTASYYVRAAEYSFCRIAGQGLAFAGSPAVYFNLTDGTVGTVSGPVTSQSITNIGGGWYRVSLTTTAVASSTAGFRISAVSTANTESFAGDGTSGIYIFGAQLSNSASVDPYVYQPVAAPASTAYYGPRFDYDPVTLAPKGLLIEEQRTQLLLNSSLAGTSLATQNVTVTAVAHTLSFYGTGTVTLSGTSTAGPLVGTGAYPARSTLTFTPTAGTLTLTVTGDVQFAQLEIGAFATSFIPSAASQVTRAADNASMIGNNFARWYNQTTGTLYAETTSANPNPWSVSGTLEGSLAANRIYIRQTSATSVSAVVDSVSPAAITISTAGYKGAVAYQIGQVALAVNGSTPTTATLASFSSDYIRLNIGQFTNSFYQNGPIKRIAYYNRRLANTELTALTS